MKSNFDIFGWRARLIIKGKGKERVGWSCRGMAISDRDREMGKVEHVSIKNSQRGGETYLTGRAPHMQPYNQTPYYYYYYYYVFLYALQKPLLINVSLTSHHPHFHHHQHEYPSIHPSILKFKKKKNNNLFGGGSVSWRETAKIQRLHEKKKTVVFVVVIALLLVHCCNASFSSL